METVICQYFMEGSLNMKYIVENWLTEETINEFDSEEKRGRVD